MIDMPVENIIKKISEEKGMPEDEIKGLIKAKCTQLAGLVSEQGAATIIANEQGVQLFKESGAVKISEIYANAKNLEVAGKVLQKYELRTFSKKDGSEGKVASFLIGDDTGITRVVLWNEQTELFQNINNGDVVIVKNPFVKENQGRLELQLNKLSAIDINPEGVSIEVKERPSEVTETKYIKDLQGGEESVEILATLVQIFDPRFFEVCPECRKKLTDGRCDTHGLVEPKENAVLSAVMDDGTGTIRTTFWKNQADILLKEDILNFKDRSFEEKKTELLGEIIKVIGNVNRNETFDRLDFTARKVFTEVNPEEEMKRFDSDGAV